MPGGDDTVWTLIEQAGGGDAARRDEFARVYSPLVHKYLGERWRGAALAGEVEDAAQDALVECLKDGGLLERADRQRPHGFRAFLFGAVRNVARRYELARLARARAHTESRIPVDPGSTEESLDRVLDREWARTLMREAAERHRRIALARGAVAREGVELLRLRFEEGLPVRDIARRWDRDPAEIHRRYRLARGEFRRALREVVAFHEPETADLDAECRRLLELLGDD